MSTPYKNTYHPNTQPIPFDIHLQTPQSEYDFNYVFPVQVLRSNRIELRPFVPSEHARLMWEGIKDHRPDITAWLGGKLDSLEEILVWHETTFHRNPAFLYHAIYTGPTGQDAGPTNPADYEFAGTMGMNNSSREDMTVEPGWIIILPKFQRTHVLTHAAGTLMHRALDEESQGGLGLRRCQWQTNSLNLKSQVSAKRLGYVEEGLIRNQRVLPLGKEGCRKGRPGEKQALAGRDTWIGSVIWEDWENGTREHVDQLMARR